MLRKILNLSLFLLMFFYIGNSEVYSQYGEDDWGDDDWWDDPWNDNGYDPDDTYLTYDEWMDFFDTNGDGVIDDNDNILDEVVVTGSSGGSGDGDGPGSNDNNDPGDDGYGDDDYGDDYGDNSNNDPPQDPSFIDASFDQSVSIPFSPIINLPIRIKAVAIDIIEIAPIVPLVTEFPVPELSQIITAYNAANNTSLNAASVISQATTSAENDTAITSPELLAFLIYLQNTIINNYPTNPNDPEEVFFEDCDGSCSCTNTVDCPCEDIVCRSGEVIDEDCECQINLLDPCANKDLINKQVSPDVLNMINARMQPNTMVQSSQMVSSFQLQTIDDGWGEINQDRYNLKIESMPDGYTPFTLFDEIRKNFDEIVTGGDIAFITTVNFEPYSPEDGVTWDSDNPVGAAMDFDTFVDTSTVYCVDYNADEMYWIFATVTSYDHQGHFVAGLRQFGIETNANGEHSFYMRGADRLGGVLDYMANTLPDIFLGVEDPLFNEAADKTWKNVMETLEDYILDKPGGGVSNFNRHGTYGSRYPYSPGDCPD